uniref:Ventral homeobox n=1 Tax=Sphaeramia orbicularis TaxID=375764 RepID=A0A673C945_9TELE
MVRYLTVSWLAQSHHQDAQDHGSGLGPAPPCRPHIPCMVQPRPPVYGKGYLQPKPKQADPGQHVESEETTGDKGSGARSPFSEVSGYSSGYESEVEQTEGLSLDEVMEVEKDEPQRRVRTKFTTEQISKLEKIFSKHKYLDAGERVKTAQKLNLSETQVRTWFQNRRMKLKREVQDYLAPQIPPVLLQPRAPVQYHTGAGQRPHYPPPFYPHPVLQHHVHPHHPQHFMIHKPHFY